MGFITRLVDQLKDLADVVGLLTAGNDGKALTWNNGAGAFGMSALGGGGLNPDGSTVGATAQPQAFTEGLQGTLIVKNPEPTYGAEVIVNGTFDGNANGWALGEGWTYANSKVSFSGSHPNSWLQQVVSTDPGAHLVTVSVELSAGQLDVYVGTGNPLVFTSPGTQAATFVFRALRDEPFTVAMYSPSNDFVGAVTAVSAVAIINQPAIELQASDSGNESGSFLQTPSGKAFGIASGEARIDIGWNPDWANDTVVLSVEEPGQNYQRLTLDGYGVALHKSLGVYTYFALPDEQTEQRFIDLPDADGTLALTSDIPQAAYCNPATATVADVINALIAAGLMASS